MILERMYWFGMGVKVPTYFKFMYTIFTGDKEYWIIRKAYFGMN